MSTLLQSRPPNCPEWDSYSLAVWWNPLNAAHASTQPGWCNMSYTLGHLIRLQQFGWFVTRSLMDWALCSWCVDVLRGAFSTFPFREFHEAHVSTAASFGDGHCLYHQRCLVYCWLRPLAPPGFEAHEHLRECSLQFPGWTSSDAYVTAALVAPSTSSLATAPDWIIWDKYLRKKII